MLTHSTHPELVLHQRFATHYTCTKLRVATRTRNTPEIVHDTIIVMEWKQDVSRDCILQLSPLHLYTDMSTLT